MASSLHVAKLEEGARAWNAWRAENAGIAPDLSDLNLSVGRRQFGPIQGGPVDLSRADLSGAALEQATLIAANLAAALLVEADLSHARMENADLRGANLSNANLDQTDLKGAQLGDATLSGAQLGHARNLTQAQIDQAIGDESTTLPPELVTPQSWLTQATPSFSRLAKRASAKASVPNGDPHGVLGVRRRASTREVRAAYLRLAKELHPDGRVDDPVAAERLKLINDAYTELKGFGGRAQARRAERKSVASRTRKVFLVGLLTSSVPVFLVVFVGFYLAGYFERHDMAAKPAVTEGEGLKQAAEPDHLKSEAARAAWAAIEKGGSREDVQRFLEEHRDSDHAEKARQALAAIDLAEAKQRAARTAWAAIEKGGSREDVQRFLEENRDSDHAAKAKQALAAIDVAEAKQRAARTAWAAIEKGGSREDVQRFLEENRDSDHAAKAKQVLAAIDLAEVKQRADSERTLDDTAWLKAERRHSKAAYKTYLSGNPGGRHAGEARVRIAELERVEKALAEAIIKEPKQAPAVLRQDAPEPSQGQRWPSADEPFIGADGRIRR